MLLNAYSDLIYTPRHVLNKINNFHEMVISAELKHLHCHFSLINSTATTARATYTDAP